MTLRDFDTISCAALSSFVQAFPRTNPGGNSTTHAGAVPSQQALRRRLDESKAVSTLSASSCRVRAFLSVQSGVGERISGGRNEGTAEDAPCGPGLMDVGRKVKRAGSLTTVGPLRVSRCAAV